MYMLFICILFMSTLTTKQTSIPSLLQEDKITSSTMLTGRTNDDTDIDAENGAVKLGERVLASYAEATHEDQVHSGNRCKETLKKYIIMKNHLS